MTLNVYRKHQNNSELFWICPNCDKNPSSEVSENEIELLSHSDLPDTYTAVKKRRGELLVIHMNGRSILPKMEELCQIIDDLGPDIVCITETWLDDSVPNLSDIPDGYKIIRKDRTEAFKVKYKKQSGGGVAIIHKSNLQISKKNKFSDPIEDILWVQVNGKKSLTLGVVYNPDYSDMLNDDEAESLLENNIRQVAESSKNILVVGDLNVNMRKKEDNLTQTLTAIYKSYGLTQHIVKATRIDPATGTATILDHVWANEGAEIKKSGTMRGLSDHLGTYVKFNANNNDDDGIELTTRNYKKYNKAHFAEDVQRNITNSNIPQLIKNKDVNGAMNNLVDIIKNTLNQHAPEITFTKKRKNKKIPWYSDKLKDMIKTKNELLQDSFNHGFRPYRKRLTAITNKIKVIKRKGKKDYILRKLNDIGKNSKLLWKLLNYLANKQKTKDDAEPEGVTQDSANSYNEYFATIGTKIQQELGKTDQKEYPEPPNAKKFNFKPETEGNIAKLIDHIRIDVAPGIDKLNARIIKDLKEVITPTLTSIINLCYKTSTFPDSMKVAIVRPIYKKDDKNDISNYRPISLLPILSKILERSATNQLIEFLESNKLLAPNQHAYRKLLSTITCLAEATNYLYRQIDNKRHTALISLDLSKAFDSINHSLLLNKLHSLGLDKHSINWVKSYLSNRIQMTRFANYTSTTHLVEAGVPQGSILGPLLFLTFTNDLPKVFEEECQMYAYADDTQLIVDASTHEELLAKIKHVITLAQEWFSSNSMKNNIGKSDILILNTHKQPKATIDITDQGKSITIESKEHIKVLGIYIDQNLSWKKQVNSVKRKSMYAVRNLHRINFFLPKNHKLNLYNSIVSPLFNYADIIWNGCNVRERNRLQTVQNFAAKSMTGRRKYQSATGSLAEYNLLRLHQRREIHEVVFAHKALKGQSSENLCKQYSAQIPACNTRGFQQGKLITPTHNTAKYERSCFYRSIKHWNEVPTSIPQHNIQTHKKLLQKHIINKTYPQSATRQNILGQTLTSTTHTTQPEL